MHFLTHQIKPRHNQDLLLTALAAAIGSLNQCADLVLVWNMTITQQHDFALCSAFSNPCLSSLILCILVEAVAV